MQRTRKLHIKPMKRTRTQQLLDEARDLMESFDDCPAMTVGFEMEETYQLTGKQMNLIASALYLADSEITYQIKKQ